MALEASSGRRGTFTTELHHRGSELYINMVNAEGRNQLGVISRGNASERCTFPLLVFKNAAWTASRTIFQTKMLQDCRTLHIVFFFGGGDAPEPHSGTGRGGAWTQTPISAWLVSVPIVPVLRNDHWSQPIMCLL